MPRTMDSMDGVVELPRRRVFSALELHAVAIGSIAALVLLGGWGFGLVVMQSIVPGYPAMNPVTAIAFMMLSLACLTSLRGSMGGARVSVALSVGVIALVIGSFLARYSDMAPPDWADPPAPMAAVGLFLAGAAMALVVVAPGASVLIGLMALVGATPALVRIVTLTFFGEGPATPGRILDRMAIHTALLIVWFMTVCVLMHPRLDFARAVFQPGLRGRMLRRALPAMILTPVIASAASSVASRAFGWPNGILFGFTATLSVTLGVGLIWWITTLVQQWQAEAAEHAARLTRANEALDQYASAAAHDLKAPARHILLYSELLEDAEKKGDIDSVRKFAGSIREAAAELPAMIESMLEYSRSAWTRLQLGQHALSEVVGSAAELHADAIRAERAHVAIVHDAVILCDATLLTAVFQNLIANSLKSARPGAPVHMKVDAACEGDHWRIVFEDNGKGIPREQASVLFKPLARGVALKGQGTGVGLATAQTIVESHRGEIHVDTDYKDGARIVFTLAAAPLPDPQPIKALPGAARS